MGLPYIFYYNLSIHFPYKSFPVRLVPFKPRHVFRILQFGSDGISQHDFRIQLPYIGLIFKLVVPPPVFYNRGHGHVFCVLVDRKFPIFSKFVRKFESTGRGTSAIPLPYNSAAAFRD